MNEVGQRGKAGGQEGGETGRGQGFFNSLRGGVCCFKDNVDLFYTLDWE